MFDISGAQNLKSSKYNKISVKVDIYLKENRIASSAEVSEIVKIMLQQQKGQEQEQEQSLLEDDEQEELL